MKKEKEQEKEQEEEYYVISEFLPQYNSEHNTSFKKISRPDKEIKRQNKKSPDFELSDNKVRMIVEMKFLLPYEAGLKSGIWQEIIRGLRKEVINPIENGVLITIPYPYDNKKLKTKKQRESVRKKLKEILPEYIRKVTEFNKVTKFNEKLKLPGIPFSFSIRKSKTGSKLKFSRLGSGELDIELLRQYCATKKADFIEKFKDYPNHLKIILFVDEVSWVKTEDVKSICSDYDSLKNTKIYLLRGNSNCERIL